MNAENARNECKKNVRGAEEARKQFDEAKIVASKSKFEGGKAREASDIAALKACQETILARK